MGALLGLDLGTKRVGIAHTDEACRMAFPLKTIEIRGLKHLIQELLPLISQYRITQIVVGFPKTLKNEVGPAAEKIAHDVDWLKTQINLPWVLWDERLTSQEIEHVLREADMTHSKRPGVRDQLAAQRILQSYIDVQGKKSQG